MDKQRRILDAKPSELHWRAYVFWLIVSLFLCAAVAAYTVVSFKLFSGALDRFDNADFLTLIGGKNANFGEAWRNITLATISIIGLGFIVWRSITAHRQTSIANEQAIIANKQAETASTNLELTEKGHVLDRFQKAVELLSDGESNNTQLAGIKLVYELASDYPESFYFSAIEQLCAVAKANSNGILIRSEREYADETPSKKEQLQNEAAYQVVRNAMEAFFNLRTTDNMQREGDWKPPLNEVQITRLGNHYRSKNAQNFHFFLGKIYNSKIEGFDFSGGDFLRANFGNTEFRNCKFVGASLRSCSCGGAKFIDCDFTDAEVFEPKYVKIDTFENCDFTNTVFAPEYMPPPDFSKLLETRHYDWIALSELEAAKLTPDQRPYVNILNRDGNLIQNALTVRTPQDETDPA